MKKKLVWLLIAVLIFSLCLSGCGKNDNNEPTEGKGKTEESNEKAEETKTLAEEQVFRFNIGGEPTILDPAHYRDDTTGYILYQINEPLLRLSDNEEGWEPGLATEYEVSDDGLVYTFHLREGAKWSDGSPITADDVVYSYCRIVDPETASRKAFDFYLIKNGEKVNKGELPVEEYGVKAKDEKTVEITLEKPVDYFRDLICLSDFGIVNKATVEEYGEYYGTDGDKTMSSGPFKIKEWNHDASLILEKNENYWDAENVILERIELNMAKDPNTIVSLYKTGELDYMDVGSDYLDEFKDTDEFNSQDNSSVKFIELNPKKEYLSNVKVRQALSMGIDRIAYVENVLANGDKAAYGLVPPGILGKDGGDFREQNGDLCTDVGKEPETKEEAKKLLDEGLKEIGKTKEDFESGVKMLCIDSPDHKRFAQAMQQMWRENLDLNVELAPLQVKMLIPILETGDFDILIGGGRKAPVNDPEDFIAFIYDEGKWDNQEYKDLIENARNSTGDERMENLMKAEQAIIENAVFIPENFQVAHYVVRKGVEGLRRYSTGVTFDWKYIQIYDVE